MTLDEINLYRPLSAPFLQLEYNDGIIFILQQKLKSVLSGTENIE